MNAANIGASQDSLSHLLRVNSSTSTLKVDVMNLIIQTKSRQGWLGSASVPCSFQHCSVLLIWLKIEQGPTVLAVDVGWGDFCFFFSIQSYFSHSLSLGDVWT